MILAKQPMKNRYIITEREDYHTIAGSLFPLSPSIWSTEVRLRMYFFRNLQVKISSVLIYHIVCVVTLGKSLNQFVFYFSDEKEIKTVLGTAQ